jgi:hypothetical protein
MPPKRVREEEQPAAASSPAAPLVAAPPKHPAYSPASPFDADAEQRKCVAALLDFYGEVLKSVCISGIVDKSFVRKDDILPILNPLGWKHKKSGNGDINFSFKRNKHKAQYKVSGSSKKPDLPANKVRKFLRMSGIPCLCSPCSVSSLSSSAKKRVSSPLNGPRYGK